MSGPCQVEPLAREAGRAIRALSRLEGVDESQEGLTAAYQRKVLNRRLGALEALASHRQAGTPLGALYQLAAARDALAEATDVGRESGLKDGALDRLAAARDEAERLLGSVTRWVLSLCDERDSDADSIRHRHEIDDDFDALAVTGALMIEARP